MQKDTVLSLVKGSTVFINYLAATAHDVAHSKQHKSISASDVLKALETIEFGDLVGPLQAELQTYRENNKGKKGGAATSAGTISVPSKPRGKGKERAGPSEAVSAPLPPPPAAQIDAPVTHAGDVDEEMTDVAEAGGLENAEGPEDEETDEDGPEEEEGEEEDEDLTDDAGEEDVEIGGLQEPDHQGEEEGHGEDR
ncbi:hypothetical protein EWM64_g6582 [Hericium alpestre]|uniref:DNA polymerase epsilon subunit D n=1 Tax=Hericium alpestre TaxID=135208 RepID=A0A4Y9ZT84_9AGAM|nr:hypothetical protein EWM64_g6582 [Hericium alpestre]